MEMKYNIYVDCANCANLMEEKINMISGIKCANVNYITQKIMIEFQEGVDEEDILKKVKKVCKKIDSDFDIEL